MTEATTNPDSSAWRAMLSAHQGDIAHTFIVKLASRCNLYCRYCYWFRDASVDQRPAVLTPEAARELPRAIRGHIVEHALSDVTIVLHGGEPLYYNKRDFDRLCHDLRDAIADTGSRLHLALTTNAVLIDDEWLDIFVRHRIALTVSLDGSKEVNDRRRVTRAGKGSFEATVRGIRRAKATEIPLAVLGVAQPDASPDDFLDAVVSECGVLYCDVLFPDLTHDDDYRAIAPYYVALFDLWFDRHLSKGVRIRTFEVLINRLVGGNRTSDIFGPKHARTVTVHTDGELDVTDVVNAIKCFPKDTDRRGHVDRGVSSIFGSARHRLLADAVADLPDACKCCDILRICGGGHIVSRWSRERGFANPSVYCEDIRVLTSHVWTRLRPTLDVSASPMTKEGRT